MITKSRMMRDINANVMVSMTIASSKDSSIVCGLMVRPHECLRVARDLVDYAGIENYISLNLPDGTHWVWYGKDFHSGGHYG